MKKNMNRAMAMGLALTVLGATTAIASETNKVVSTPATMEETVQSETPAEDVKFIQANGTISSLTTREDGSVEVLIDNANGGLRFMVSPTTIVLNRADNTYVTAADLKDGMEIAVVYGANSPMGMSMPPYLGEVTAVIANADAGNIAVSAFDETLLSTKDKLMLNISDETVIMNVQGSRIRLTAEDVKNTDAVVFYDATTKSIPAQTTPSFVLILTTETTEETAVIDDETMPIAMPETVALRATATEMGYSVVWQGKDKAILLEKEGMTIEVYMGSSNYTVNGEAATSAAMANLVDGVMFVGSDVLA